MKYIFHGSFDKRRLGVGSNNLIRDPGIIDVYGQGRDFKDFN